jgi:hypothetical protein
MQSGEQLAEEEENEDEPFPEASNGWAALTEIAPNGESHWPDKPTE